MKKVQETLKGNKTYIVGGLMIVIGLINLISGDISLVDLIQKFQTMPEIRILLEGAGLLTIRHAISTK